MPKDKKTETLVELIIRYRKAPDAFVREVLKAEPTSQQLDVLKAIGSGEKRIAIRSGHGTGKSAMLAWLILWFLFCYEDARIPCTAGTSSQLSDTLWPEISKWLHKMRPEIKDLYEWSSERLSMKENPTKWFAVARTSRKEKPEALQGFHAAHLLFIIDEASGVPNEVFEVAHGSLTSQTAIVVMTGNPTRLVGYFYDAFHKNKAGWARFHFSSKESSLVDDEYVKEIVDNYGEDSDQYSVRVLGDFPRSDAVDDKGYIQLIEEKDVQYTDDMQFGHDAVMGIDPSGDGDDKTVWVLRDNFKAMVLSREQHSTPKSIAERTLSLMDKWDIPPNRIYVDNFGEGANVIPQIINALQFKGNLMPIGLNVGKDPQHKDYLNMRAEAFDRVRKWLRTGGKLVANDSWKELHTIRYRRNLRNKMQIMGKQDMKKEGLASPDVADALMLTFVDDIETPGTETEAQKNAAWDLVD